MTNHRHASRASLIGVFFAVATIGVAGMVGCSSVADSLTGDADGGNSGGGSAKFSALYASYLNQCSACHAPNAAGRGPTTETELDFSTVDTAYASLKGSAAGLTGNQEACNGAKFIVPGKPQQSLLVATLDGATRKSFVAPSPAGCDADAVSDMTNKVGAAPSAAFLDSLKAWITAGALKD